MKLRFFSRLTRRKDRQDALLPVGGVPLPLQLMRKELARLEKQELELVRQEFEATEREIGVVFGLLQGGLRVRERRLHSYGDSG